MMFTVIYAFNVKQGQDKEFKSAWKELTKLITEHAGGLGSRLHRHDGNKYISYAQWPDRNIWLSAENQLPEVSNDIRKIMQESCEKIETLYELEVIADLLKHD